MESDRYHTLAKPENGDPGIREGKYTEKGSKFIAFAFPMESEEEMQTRLREVKKGHHKARHHCYAFRINPRDPYFRAQDDGEPVHSAGTPILHQILSRELWDLGVIVLRYFGGTKLGIPGLIRAYGTAAARALDSATIAERYITGKIHVRFDYPLLNDVMTLIKKYGAGINEQSQSLDCRYLLEVREELFPSFREEILSLPGISEVRATK